MFKVGDRVVVCWQNYLYNIRAASDYKNYLNRSLHNSGIIFALEEPCWAKIEFPNGDRKTLFSCNTAIRRQEIYF